MPCPARRSSNEIPIVILESIRVFAVATRRSPSRRVARPTPAKTF
nr:MAG TPA: hypothetical protein [Caudoviricetes sp.]